MIVNKNHITKKLSLLILMIFNYSCIAQVNKINSNESTINSISYLGNNVSFVIQDFDQPNTIEDYYYEIEDVMSKKYIYNDILFYIIDDTVDSFEITGGNYLFTNNNIKIGDNIQNLNSFYPISFANKNSEALYLDFNDIDMHIIISYNSFNNLIDKIAIYSY